MLTFGTGPRVTNRRRGSALVDACRLARIRRTTDTPPHLYASERNAAAGGLAAGRPTLSPFVHPHAIADQATRAGARHCSLLGERGTYRRCAATRARVAGAGTGGRAAGRPSRVDFSRPQGELTPGAQRRG